VALRTQMRCLEGGAGTLVFSRVYLDTTFIDTENPSNAMFLEFEEERTQVARKYLRDFGRGQNRLIQMAGLATHIRFILILLTDQAVKLHCSQYFKNFVQSLIGDVDMLNRLITTSGPETARMDMFHITLHGKKCSVNGCRGGRLPKDRQDFISADQSPGKYPQATHLSVGECVRFLRGIGYGGLSATNLRLMVEPLCYRTKRSGESPGRDKIVATLAKHMRNTSLNQESQSYSRKRSHEFDFVY